MKNANVWVIFSMIAVSLILGFLVPIEESQQRIGSQHRGDSDLVANGDVCAPFITHDIRYASVELRLAPAERQMSIEF